MDNKEKLQPWLSSVPSAIGHYLAGFADGEGSFSASLRKRSDHKAGWQIVLIFNVAQRDTAVLSLFKKHLGCGRLQKRKDGVHYYVVANYKMIHERVIPFFETYGFLSEGKKHNFMVFKKIAQLMNEGAHLTKPGFNQIVELREELNPGRGRKRKYKQLDYQTPLQ